MRLNRYLQRGGVGSLREAERLVADGLVTVNGKPALATTVVEEGDDVRVGGKKISPAGAPLPRVFALHKPLDILVTANDPQGRPTVYDILPRGMPRVMPVGRLDVNSEGLLLLTTDGPLAQTLMSPKTALEREYRVRAFGVLTEEKVDKIRTGVVVKGVRYQGARLTVEPGGEGKNRWYRIVLTEGKNREIRKIFEHFGCVVNRLIRLRYGTVRLGAIPRGAVVELPPGEVKKLMKAAGYGLTKE